MPRIRKALADDVYHDLLDECLREAVTTITRGAADQPRPGQRDLAHAVLDALLGAAGGDVAAACQTAGQAPTGSGKTLTLLAPAFLVAVLDGERAVISTDSLSLQAQLVERDAPVVAAAVAVVLRRRFPGQDITEPTCAVLKGWGNYGCTASAVASLEELTGQGPGDLSGNATLPQVAGLARFIADTRPPLPAEQQYTARKHTSTCSKTGCARCARAGTPGPQVRAALEAMLTGDWPRVPARAVKPQLALIDGQEVPVAGLLDATAWILDANGDPGTHYAACPTGIPRQHWDDHLSLPASACAKSDCPFYEACPAVEAARQAADAAVIVTNHTLLAIQATTGAPVVLGRRSLGRIDHLLVDEAHTLTDKVRATGANEVSPTRIRTIMFGVKRVLADDTFTRDLFDRGDLLADQVTTSLDRLAASWDPRSSPGDDVRVPADVDPLATVRAQLDEWVNDALASLPGDDKVLGDTAMLVRVRKLKETCTRMAKALEDSRTAQVGVARWVRRDNGHARGNAALCMSPVDVARLIKDNLLSAQALPVLNTDGRPTGEHDPDDHRLFDADDDGPPRFLLGAAMISATLPARFAREAGLACDVIAYPSPFAGAYARSMAFIPSITQSEKDTLSADRFTRAHPAWAKNIITQLVNANGGRALILSSTSAAGQTYASHLRTHTSIPILSQWDSGISERDAMGRWVEQEAAVMVGTKKLMTGVDAAGDTCSLVIIDRVPRAPTNAVDEARVDVLVDAGVNKFEAARRVYVADACLLLQQAAGRLIRSASDTGMVAILDPRLLDPHLNHGLTRRSNDPASRDYRAVVSGFGTRKADLACAVNWLRARHSVSAQEVA